MLSSDLPKLWTEPSKTGHIFRKLLLFFQTNNKSSSSFQFHPALFNSVTPVMSLKRLTIPKHETISSKQRNRTSITVISDANVKFKFNAKKTFKTAILCVRFLVRLKRIKITPVLFNLDATRCNPYHMRNIRHSIGKLSKNYLFIIYLRDGAVLNVKIFCT